MPGRRELVSYFAAVKHTQHDQALAIGPILKYIGSVQNLQNDLPIFLAALDRTPEIWVIDEDLRLFDNFSGDDSREPRMPLLKKYGKTIKIGERCVRPLKPHRSCHRRKAGVPQVRSQRTTSS